MRNKGRLNPTRPVCQTQGNHFEVPPSLFLDSIIVLFKLPQIKKPPAKVAFLFLMVNGQIFGRVFAVVRLHDVIKKDKNRRADNGNDAD